MKRISAFVLLIVWGIGSAAALSADQPGVVVWRLRVGSGVSDSQGRRLEQEITGTLRSVGSFDVMSLERRDDILAQPGTPDRNCISNECLSQAGNLLKVNWIITGDVGRVGSTYMLNMLLVEASTGNVTGIYSRTSSASGLAGTASEGARSLAAQAPAIDTSEPSIETEGPSGTVIIRSRPGGAQVYIDAFLIGRTPTVAYRVPVGEHSVTFVLEGHDTARSSVSVKEGKTVEVDEILLMRTGSIEVDSSPSGSELYFDGKHVGKTPQKLEGILIGNHSLRIESKGYRPFETSVRIEENGNQKRTFTLSKAGVMVLITSQPEGAQVYVDGAPAGQALYLGSFEPGRHTITVQLPGFGTQTRQVELAEGKSYAFHFRMVKGGEETATPFVGPQPPPPPAAENEPRQTGGAVSSNPEAQKYYEQASASQDIEERIRLYRRAIALDPKFAPAHNDLGVDFAELNRWDEAIMEYKAALAIDPDYTFAHNNLGHAYLNTERIDEAISELKAALRLDPNYATAHYNLGKAYFIQEKYQEALAEFRKTADLDPKHAGAYFNMGRTLKRLSKYDEAISMYQRCLEADPTYIDAYYNLGDLYEAKGDSKAAVYYYRKYISVETRPGEEEWVEKARERIRALGGGE